MRTQKVFSGTENLFAGLVLSLVDAQLAPHQVLVVQALDGGLGTLAPTRRDEIVAFGLRAILAGTIASCMTGAAIGIMAG